MSKLLVIGFVWPEPNSSAAGSRMLQLLNLFLDKNYDITFATACAKTDNAFDLSTLGIQQEIIQLNDSSFDEFLKELQPDVVMFDRFMIEEQFGWRVSENCPNAIKLLDTEDLHCLRKGRQQAIKDQKEFDDNYLFSDIAKREIASVYRCDLTFMISEVEMELLQTKFKVDASLLHYLPFLLDNTSQKQDLPTIEERQHFVTIGNFMHPPNYDAVLFLKQTIWTKIRQQLPNAELHIYGAYVSQKASQLHNEKQGFFIKGFAEDVNEVMQQAKVCLSYLRFGAGLKGKLIDAMQNGTPCAMSTIAAEGMFGNLKPNGIVENDIDAFVNKTVELYNNETLWKQSQQQGFETLKNRFDLKLFNVDFNKKLDYLQNNLHVHRQQNFIGSMLQHHSLQSTKYLSKWIEEKNK